MGSVPEHAQQLISFANDYIQNSMASSSTVGDDVNRALQNLTRVRELATDSISTAANILGEAHGGMLGILASALQVSDKVEAAEGLFRAAVDALLDVDAATTHHSNVMGQIGHDLLQGRG